MKTLNNKQFMCIFHESSNDGKVDDEQLENTLSTYFPYNLVFKGNLRKKTGDE